MKIYIAACYTNNYRPGGRNYAHFTEHEAAIARAVPNILESFHYVSDIKYVEKMRGDSAQIFLDSGAFSAHNFGVEISVEAYCDYIRTNMDLIRVEDGVLMASVLDAIGDDAATYRNQRQMERLGCKPLPCFHTGEDSRYLDLYANNYEYITLGGLVGAGPDQLRIWLDRIWDKHLTDGAGRPRCKVHGFGITSIPLMESYPWHSCDSSSWIQATAWGSIVTNDFGPLWVSRDSPARHDAGQHIFTLSPIERATVEASLERDGFTLKRLSECYQSRAAYNLLSYTRMQDAITAKETGRFQLKVQELW